MNQINNTNINKYYEKRGITLISLIVTIIIIFILAGIIVNLTIGERSIFNRAIETSQKSKIGEYVEKIELSRGDVGVQNYGIVTIDNLINQIYIDEIVPQGYITKLDEISAEVITKEGYVFIITTDETKYIEKREDIPNPPDLQEGDITFKIEPSGWTRENVVVTASTKIKGYTLQTSKDEITWTSQASQIFSENGNIYVRLIDSRGQSGGIIIEKVTNIDVTKPEVTEVTKNTNGTITIKGSDEASGIIGYTITQTTETPTLFTDCENITNLNVEVTTDVKGTFYIWLKDAVENIGGYEVITHTHSDGEGNPYAVGKVLYQKTDPGGCFVANGHTHNKTGTCSTTTVNVPCNGTYSVKSDPDGSVYCKCNKCGHKAGRDDEGRKCWSGNKIPQTSYTCGSPVNTWKLTCSKSNESIDGIIPVDN